MTTHLRDLATAIIATLALAASLIWLDRLATLALDGTVVDVTVPLIGDATTMIDIAPLIAVGLGIGTVVHFLIAAHTFAAIAEHRTHQLATVQAR